MGERRFSHAIAEGDGISVIAAVEDPDAARAAEQQRAEALVVRSDPRLVRQATSLPILWRARVSPDEAALVADALTLPFDGFDDAVHARALELGLDCAVEVRSEEEIEEALERIDPEIFLLATDGDLEAVLDLLAAVPAGKLAIADLATTTPDEVQELERAGCDAVLVEGVDVSPLAGSAPPEV